MTIDEFIALMEDKSPPIPEEELAAFEAEIGAELPETYRQFLARSNGGYIRGWYRFKGPTPEGRSPSAFVSDVGGLRDDPNLSLRFARGCYLAPPGLQDESENKIPAALLWIIGDPGGNGICLGLTGSYRGRVYFWIHDEPPAEEQWDGTVESAANIILLANSFTEFIAGIGPMDRSEQ
jgi:hypothetical protein